MHSNYKGPFFNIFSVTGFLVNITPKVVSGFSCNFYVIWGWPQKVLTSWEISGY